LASPAADQSPAFFENPCPNPVFFGVGAVFFFFFVFLFCVFSPSSDYFRLMFKVSLAPRVFSQSVISPLCPRAALFVRCVLLSYFSDLTSFIIVKPPSFFLLVGTRGPLPAVLPPVVWFCVKAGWVYFDERVLKLFTVWNFPFTVPSGACLFRLRQLSHPGSFFFFPPRVLFLLFPQVSLLFFAGHTNSGSIDLFLLQVLGGSLFVVKMNCSVNDYHTHHSPFFLLCFLPFLGFFSWTVFFSFPPQPSKLGLGTHYFLKPARLLVRPSLWFPNPPPPPSLERSLVVQSPPPPRPRRYFFGLHPGSGPGFRLTDFCSPTRGPGIPCLSFSTILCPPSL